MPVLELKNLTVKIRENLILDSINLKVEKCDFLGIIGPNGGGKSTLLKSIIGIQEITSGEILFNGNPISNSKTQIGYVPQNTSLSEFFPITVFEVVKLGLLGKKYPFKKIDSNDNLVIQNSLNSVGLGGYENKLINNLSGGEVQRVFIARALVSNPKMLLLDEPTASVDSKSGTNFFELLRELNKEITIIMVSHDIGAVSQYVNKIACLNRKLAFHDSKELTKDMLEDAYQCPVDLIAHGVPHRVLDKH